MSETPKIIKDHILYQGGFHDGFIEGRNEGIKLAKRVIEGSSNPKLEIRNMELIAETTYPKSPQEHEEDFMAKKADFESHPNGKPMRIAPG